MRTKSVGQRMENIQFEITHERLVALIADRIDIDPGQLTLLPITGEETSAIKAIIRTDLQTANKIDKLEGEAVPETPPQE